MQSIRSKFTAYRIDQRLSSDGKALRLLAERLFRNCTSAECTKSEFAEQLSRSKYAKRPKIKEWISATQSTDTLSLSDALDLVSTSLEYSNDKTAKLEKSGVVQSMVFECLHTTVSTSEFQDLLLDSGACGGSVPAEDYIPDRSCAPTFLSHPWFSTKSPAQVTWVQLRRLITDFSLYGNRVVEVDAMFHKLQKKEFDLLPDNSKVNNTEVTDNMICSKVVPFMTFYKKFTSKLFPEDDVFWTTEVGKSWIVQAQSLDQSVASGTPVHPEPTITWTKVYTALQAVMPQMLSVDESLHYDNVAAQMVSNDNNPDTPHKSENNIDNTSAPSNTTTTSLTTSSVDVPNTPVSPVVASKSLSPGIMNRLKMKYENTRQIPIIPKVAVPDVAVPAVELPKVEEPQFQAPLPLPKIPNVDPVQFQVPLPKIPKVAHVPTTIPTLSQLKPLPESTTEGILQIEENVIKVDNQVTQVMDNVNKIINVTAGSSAPLSRISSVEKPIQFHLEGFKKRYPKLK